MSTDVGASLLRGSPDAAPDPPSRAPRVSCPAVQVQTDSNRAPAAAPAEVRPRSGSRSSGGELARHPFRDERGRAGSPAGPPRRRSPPGDTGAGLVELAQAVQRKHRGFTEVISAREGHVGIVKAFWQKGDVRACVSAVHRCGDPGFAVDMFRFLRARDRTQHYQLNMCTPTAAAVQMCLRAQSDTVAMVALSFLELVLRGFAADIRAGCAYVERERGPVDIKGEERRQLCREARDAFVEVLPAIQEVAAGKRGQPRALQERASGVADRIQRMVK